MSAAFGTAALRAALAPAERERLRAVELLDEVDSTNAVLLRRAPEDPAPALLVARRQNAGRGRRGRRWHSPPDANLYLSLRVALAPAALPPMGVSLVAGAACVEALRALGFDEVGLKWPNDLLARGSKLGGVLVELAPRAMVIGVGINVDMQDATEIDQPWIALAQLGAPPGIPQLAARIAAHLLDAVDEHARHGLAALAARWDRLDAVGARRVRVLCGEGAFEGIACGLAPDGALRVRVGEAERLVHSAEVSLRCA